MISEDLRWSPATRSRRDERRSPTLPSRLVVHACVRSASTGWRRISALATSKPSWRAVPGPTTWSPPKSEIGRASADPRPAVVRSAVKARGWSHCSKLPAAWPLSKKSRPRRRGSKPCCSAPLICPPISVAKQPGAKPFLAYALPRAWSLPALLRGSPTSIGLLFDVKDHDGLTPGDGASAVLGFAGKAVIHPNQIAAINAALTPCPEDAAQARARTWPKNAKGAGVVQGHMVDEAVAQARPACILIAAGEPVSASGSSH